jgi:hypothetical protein
VKDYIYRGRRPPRAGSRGGGTRGGGSRGGGTQGRRHQGRRTAVTLMGRIPVTVMGLQHLYRIGGAGPAILYTLF